MKLQNTDLTLYALFCLRRQTLPAHSGTLGRLTGRTATETTLDLLQLESVGLVEAATVRLTMIGLARAAQLARASGDVAAAPEVSIKPRKAVRRIKPPVAAKTLAVEVAVDETPEALSA